ncbi:DUF5808 domain-containing protein [Halpernia humi]|uniref:DUF5808 domain-containing protein n=1 Tax=Halpernia humi TaxID=493375 RepID=UPI002936EF05|nr:DUF5808 domain-containing protein [Halpernia humi]
MFCKGKKFVILSPILVNIKEIENDHNKYWKWKIFYYNPEDKRLFPPKRNPAFGWTINFANWKSIFAFVLLLAFFAFILGMIESRS